MGGARRQFDATFEMVPHSHSMGQVRKHPNWRILEFVLRSDFSTIYSPSLATKLVRKCLSELLKLELKKFD